MAYFHKERFAFSSSMWSSQIESNGECVRINREKIFFIIVKFDWWESLIYSEWYIGVFEHYIKKTI